MARAEFHTTALVAFEQTFLLWLRLTDQPLLYLMVCIMYYFRVCIASSYVQRFFVSFPSAIIEFFGELSLSFYSIRLFVYWPHVSLNAM